jgi:hypothetical protein
MSIETETTAQAFARQHARVFGGAAEPHPSSISDAVVARGAYWPEPMTISGDLYAGSVLLSCYATGCAARDPDIADDITQALVRVGVHARPATIYERDALP